MEFKENKTSITVENNKGDFAFSYRMEKGASWSLAKQAVAEIYEEIVRRELQAYIAQQAAEAAAKPESMIPVEDVVAEVIPTDEV